MDPESPASLSRSRVLCDSVLLRWDRHSRCAASKGYAAIGEVVRSRVGNGCCVREAHAEKNLHTLLNGATLPSAATALIPASNVHRALLADVTPRTIIFFV